MYFQVQFLELLLGYLPILISINLCKVELTGPFIGRNTHRPDYFRLARDMSVKVIFILLKLFPLFKHLPSLFKSDQAVLVLVKGLEDAVPPLLAGIAERRLWIDFHIEADKLVKVGFFVAIAIRQLKD